jgi:transposase
MDLRLDVLRKEVKENRKESQRVTERLLALIELTKFKNKYGCVSEVDRERIAAKFETTARTLYRWEKSYRERGVKGLFPKTSPGRKPNSIRGHTAKKIRQWRKLYNWGAEVIQAHLQHDHGVKVSRFKIEQYLRKKGLLFRKIKNKPKKKHAQVVKVDHPGAHTQTDVKHLPHTLPEGKKCYVYNFVDHASKWSFKKVYDSYGPSETKDFFSWVVRTAPFVIKRAQTDNGVEFTNKYISHCDDPKIHALDEFCASYEIRHVLIPPGEKELQGLVERSHRQDDEEFYHRIKPRNLEEFNQILTQHCEWRNSRRRRKALGWKTSTEFLAEYNAKIKAWLYENQPSPFVEKVENEKKDLEKKLEEPNNEIVINDTVKKVA